MEKVVMITGASSGIGLHTAKLFQIKNWKVAATMRVPESPSDLDNIVDVEKLRLDVTEPETVLLPTELVVRGVLVAPVILHTGVSSLEPGEPPLPERYHVPAATASLVNAVHGWNGRVIAVGTTVVRALETVATADGTVSEGQGSTSLVVTPERGLRAIDGLLSGLHERESSHLELLEATAGAELVKRSYAAALAHGYLWHEFGDLHLILP